MSFEREFGSHWSGTSAGSFYSAEVFDKCRKIQLPETTNMAKGKEYYVFGIDVGRSAKEGCQTVVSILKVIPGLGLNVSTKQLVNIVSLNTGEDDGHFERQAIEIKKLYNKFLPRAIIIDGNGLGVGLVDFLTIVNRDDKTMIEYPAFGVQNDDTGEYRKRARNQDLILKDVLYIVKANPAINDICHTNVLMNMGSEKLEFLGDERVARAKLLNTDRGKSMSPEERAEFLLPFNLTSILKAEMCNLIEKRDGIHIQLERSNANIQKDKFSSLEYGLYYIKLFEDDNKKRRKHATIGDMMFFTRGN